MNSLHKKRQAFRQAVRSKSIQDLFRRKRQELLELLRQNMCKDLTKILPNNLPVNIFHGSTNQLMENSNFTGSYTDLIKKMTQIGKLIGSEEQLHIFLSITESHKLKSLQKVDILSKLINLKEFCLDSEIQHHYGWKRIIEEFLNAIQQNEEAKGDNLSSLVKSQFPMKMNESNRDQKIETFGFKNQVCFSLIKIWQLKPKTEHFLIFTKSYHLIHQKLSNNLSLTLIAQLSYDRVLVPSYQFIKKLFEVNIDNLTQVKFFRTLEILKNFIFHFRVDNSQIHARQLFFEYINWIKVQINLLLSTQEYSADQFFQNKLPFQSFYIEFETRYCLIYLLFTTLNKLYEVNEKEKQLLDTKQILIFNEQLLNHTQNHTTLKFMIQEGKTAVDPYHKNNILRTLTFFINFIQISTLGKNKQQNNLGAEIEEIEKTFQGTELNWFETFN